MRQRTIAVLVLAACLAVALGSAAFARMDNIYIAAPYVWGTRTVSWSNYVAIAPNMSYNHNLYGAVEGGGLVHLQLDATTPVVHINSESYVALATEKLYDPSNLSWGNIVYGARADGGIDMCQRIDGVWSTISAELDGAPIQRKYISLATSGCTSGAPNPHHIYAVRQDGLGIDWLVYHPAVDEDPAYWTRMESIGNADGTPHTVAYTKVVSPAEQRNFMYALRADGFVDAIFRSDDFSLFANSRVFRPEHETATYVDISQGPGSYTISFAARSDGGIDRFFWGPENQGANGGDEVRPNTDPVYTALSPDAGTNHCIYGISEDGLFRISWDYAYWQQTGIVRWPLNQMNNNVYDLLTLNARYGNEMFAVAGGAPPNTVASIADAKTAENAAPVLILGALVSGSVLTDEPINLYKQHSFGIITPDYAQGIRVVWSPDDTQLTVLPGDVVNVVGSVGFSNYYERVIFADSVEFAAYGEVPAPFAMQTAATGGSARGPQDAVVDDGTVFPLVRAVGVPNLGLPVTIYGKVTYVHEDLSLPISNGYFYVDDGCGLMDGAFTTEGEVTTYRVGVKCRPYIDQDGVPFMPLEGQYVSVTGLMGCRKPGEDLYQPGRYLYTTAPIVTQKAWQ